MLELTKTPEEIARVNQALTFGERHIAEQIENQPAQGRLSTVFATVCARLILRTYVSRIVLERVAPTIESEPVPPLDVPSADAAIVPGGDGGDAFDTADLHHGFNRRG